MQTEPDDDVKKLYELACDYGRRPCHHDCVASALKLIPGIPTM